MNLKDALDALGRLLTPKGKIRGGQRGQGASRACVALRVLTLMSKPSHTHTQGILITHRLGFEAAFSGFSSITGDPRGIHENFINFYVSISTIAFKSNNSAHCANLADTFSQSMELPLLLLGPSLSAAAPPACSQTAPPSQTSAALSSHGNCPHL